MMNTDEWMRVVAIGIGATATTDLWALLRKRLLDVAPPNYAMIGRWIAHLARGRARHDAIAKAAPVAGELSIGWTAHYAIGIGFACLLPAVAGNEWLRRPTLIPALLVGVGTVAAPFLVMQPAMGAGLASSRTPRPNAARLQSLVTHFVFGLGLFLSALPFATGD
jgi:hypothetical protein